MLKQLLKLDNHRTNVIWEYYGN